MLILTEVGDIVNSKLPFPLKRRFIDLSKEGVDAEAFSLLNQLKDNLRGLMENAKENVLEYKMTQDEAIGKIQGSEVKTGGGKVTLKTTPTQKGEIYRRKLCDAVCTRLSDILLKRYETDACEPSHLFDEIVRHLSFQREKLDLYVERPEIQNVIIKYIETGDILGGRKQKPENLTLVLKAESGAGKTALMAWASKWASKLKNSIVITRFLGTTPLSSEVTALLKSLCQQISEILEIDGAENQDNSKNVPIEDLVKLLSDLLVKVAKSFPEKKIFLFLDSVDQLLPTNNAHQLRWLPLKSPQNVFIVTSVLSQVVGEKPTVGLSSTPDLFGQLTTLFEPITKEFYNESSNPDLWSHQIKSMSLETARAALDCWFGKNESTPEKTGGEISPKTVLTPEMKQQILVEFEKCPTPLFLRVAADLAVLGQFSPLTSVIPSHQNSIQFLSREIISKVFTGLENVHGPIFVGHVLAYLVISKFGISSPEMEDIISCDEEVLEGDGVFKYWLPPVRRLPPLLWKRLKEDLGWYIVDKGIYDVVVHNLYHRQFWETAEANYLPTQTEKSHLALHLARYFNGDFSSPFAIPFEDKKRGIKGREDRLISSQPLLFVSNLSSDPSKTNSLGLSPPENSRKSVYNYHKLIELPYQQVHSLDLELLASSLYNFEFIEAKCSAGMLYELIEDYIMAISYISSQKNTAENELHVKNLGEFQRFLVNQAPVLEKVPKQAIFLAANGADNNVVTETAKDQLRQNAFFLKKVRYLQANILRWHSNLHLIGEKDIKGNRYLIVKR